MLVLDDALEVQSSTPAAERWLAEITAGEQPRVGRLPNAIYAVAVRLRSLDPQGLSTLEIAARLHISPNTVQDHLKAIFAKVGVRSRRGLVAQIFAEHYWPRIVRGTPLASDGWFRDGAPLRP